VQRRKVVSYSIGSLSPFEGDIIAYSREGNNTPTFQEIRWKAMKTNANKIKGKSRKRPLMMQAIQNQQRKGK
jgi:hypothetical protein